MSTPDKGHAGGGNDESAGVAGGGTSGAEPTKNTVVVREEPPEAGAAKEDAATAAKPTTCVKNLDANLLPTFYAILRTVERENEASDQAQKNKDSLEAAVKIADFFKRIDALRAGVHRLSGISKSPQEQEQELKQLKKQLELKKKLLEKYKNIKFKENGLSGATVAAADR